MPRALTSLVVVMACSCGPSQECRDYVACQKAVDPSVETKDYDDRGVCWNLPSSARDCTAVCVEALATLQQVSDAPACFPD